MSTLDLLTFPLTSAVKCILSVSNGQVAIPYTTLQNKYVKHGSVEPLFQRVHILVHTTVANSLFPHR